MSCFKKWLNQSNEVDKDNQTDLAIEVNTDDGDDSIVGYVKTTAQDVEGKELKIHKDDMRYELGIRISPWQWFKKEKVEDTE